MYQMNDNDDNWHRTAGIKATLPSISSPMVDMERMRPDHWLGLLLSVPFSALTLGAGWQEEHPAHENPLSLIPSSSLPEKVKKDPSWNWLTQGHRQKTAIKWKQW